MLKLANKGLLEFEPFSITSGGIGVDAERMSLSEFFDHILK